MLDTVSTLEKEKTESSSTDSWTDEYMAHVMRNQAWLIEQVKNMKRLELIILTKKHRMSTNGSEVIDVDDLKEFIR